MPDGRRSQWFAMDAWFFDNPLGVAIRERFGVTGLVLFIGFLGACKRSHIQGQIAYSSDLDALRLMGLPDLRLVDDAGAEWDLDTFWRVLGQLKQTRRTARGRVKNVKATHWGKWQESFERANEAARKRRSRGKNTPDDAPPLPGHYPDDAPPLHRTDSDSDNDSDKEGPTSVADGLLAEWFEARSPRPILKRGQWVGMRKTVQQAVDLGNDPETVRIALRTCDVVSAGWLETALRKVKPSANGHAAAARAPFARDPNGPA